MKPLPLTDRNEDGSPEPFFTHARPCESCGRPVNPENLKPAGWAPELNVGPCCREYLADSLPDQPVCHALLEFFWYEAETVAQIQQAFRRHLASCPECQKAARKPVERISRSAAMQKEAA
jgi:hypothetical protein